jgi:hypothetical protein
MPRSEKKILNQDEKLALAISALKFYPEKDNCNTPYLILYRATFSTVKVRFLRWLKDCPRIQ